MPIPFLQTYAFGVYILHHHAHHQQTMGSTKENNNNPHLELTHGFCSGANGALKNKRICIIISYHIKIKRRSYSTGTRQWYERAPLFGTQLTSLLQYPSSHLSFFTISLSLFLPVGCGCASLKEEKRQHSLSGWKIKTTSL